MTADLAHGSLHETLGRAGFVLRRGTGTIAAAAATAEDARLLGDPDRRPAARRAARHQRRARPAGSRRPNRATPADRYALAIAFEVEAPDRGDDGLEP